MSSSSSRIAGLKYAANRQFNKRKVVNKFKKPLGSLHAYGLRTNNFYNQNKIEECCEKSEEFILNQEDSCGNIILKISPATDLEKQRNPNIRSSLGILVPKYKKNSDVSNNYWTPHENYTLLYNVMFKTTKSDVKIIDYNRDYVALPPGQVGWDDKLLKLSPEFYYYYVILSSSKKKVPIDKYIPLVYLNTLESDDFKLTKTGPVRNNKNQNNEYNASLRLLEETNNTNILYTKYDLSGSELDINI